MYSYTLCIISAAAAPEVYTVIPPQPLEKKPGQLEQWQLEEFFDKGLVPKFFTKEELQPVLNRGGIFRNIIYFLRVPNHMLYIRATFVSWVLKKKL